MSSMCFVLDHVQCDSYTSNLHRLLDFDKLVLGFGRQFRTRLSDGLVSLLDQCCIRFATAVCPPSLPSGRPVELSLWCLSRCRRRHMAKIRQRWTKRRPPNTDARIAASTFFFWWRAEAAFAFFDPSERSSMEMLLPLLSRDLSFFCCALVVFSRDEIYVS